LKTLTVDQVSFITLIVFCGFAVIASLQKQPPYGLSLIKRHPYQKFASLPIGSFIKGIHKPFSYGSAFRPNTLLRFVKNLKEPCQESPLKVWKEARHPVVVFAACHDHRVNLRDSGLPAGLVKSESRKGRRRLLTQRAFLQSQFKKLAMPIF
jgi:hypothetical protein